MTLQQELTQTEYNLTHLNKEDPCYYEEYENFASIKAYLVEELGRGACGNALDVITDGVVLGRECPARRPRINLRSI